MKEDVILIKCDSYERDEIQAALLKIFSLAGIKKNAFDKILFKPNMLSARLPEDGVTTHPQILEEAILFFQSSKKIIGDSPANSLKPIPLYWDKCGFKEVSEKTGVDLVKFDTSFFVTVVTDKGEMQVPVTPFIKDFSIINLAKLKTHGLTILTGAMKNLYGLIPGYHKSLLHSKFITPWEFSGFLADYYHEVSKYLSFNIVDAVVSMEGEGPSSGKLKKTGYLIGGRNAVAIERVCCQLLGVNERSVPYLQRYKEKYGLPEVEIKGDELVPVKGFVVPGKRLSKFMSNKVIKFILNILAKHFHIMPVIEPEKCKKCYACVQVCPVNAISKELVFDRKICINCLCCFEVCPYKAIKVKKNWVAKFFT